jgi:hypothetical protein
VQFIVSSRGRPIGTTELDFTRILDAGRVGETEGPDSRSNPLQCFRSGWFHPNSLGETLMPNVALLLPAMRAFVCRNGRDANGQSILAPHFRGSSLFADLAEAFHRIEVMELSLHHADGTMIPTVQVGIQDTQQLIEFGRSQALELEPDPTLDEEEEEWDADLEQPLAGRFDLPSRGWQPSDDEDDDVDLDEIVRMAYEKLADHPRYQVHVELVDASAIP